MIRQAFLRRNQPGTRRIIVASVLALCALVFCGTLAAQEPTTLVSVSSSGTIGSDASRQSTISDDGRFVAFQSYAPNLVEGDLNWKSDVFLHDRLTRQTTRISVGPGLDGGEFPVLSANGSFVAFLSDGQIFVHDRLAGTTTLVSRNTSGVAGNLASSYPAISDDGQFVAFLSSATNLVADDLNGTNDVFVHDRAAGETTRVSAASDGTEASSTSLHATISGNGRFVAFDSYATNLVPGDTNGALDIFVHDRLLGTTSRVSVATGGRQANGASFEPAISGEGRFVAFLSVATSLVADDTNGWADVFVHDRATGATTRVSVGPGGTQGNSPCAAPAISGDGRFVVFESSSTVFASGDTNNAIDVFLHDRTTGRVERLSVGPAGIQANSHSYDPDISTDGRFVSFASVASNLTSTHDGNGTWDVFVRDREVVIPPSQQTLSVILGGTGSGAVTSVPAGIDCGSDCTEDFPDDIAVTLTAVPAVGSVFSTWSGACTGTGPCTVSMTRSRSVVAIFALPGPLPTTARVSISTSGNGGNDESARPALSADGRFVAFTSKANNLVSGDTGWEEKVFVRDRTTATTTLVSVGLGGVPPNSWSSKPALSADGRFVAFESPASTLVPGDTNLAVDVFVHERGTGTTERISVGPGGVQGAAWSQAPAISGDGRFVAFDSRANNLVADDSPYRGVFVHDRQTHQTTCVSVGQGGSRAQGDSHSPVVSADGRFVAFLSAADNLVADDTNRRWDVFVHDRASGATTRIPMGPGGANDGSDGGLAISADGRFVAFETWSAVASDDTNGVRDVYVHDRLTGNSARVSVGPAAQQLDGESFDPAMSADGRFVAFMSEAETIIGWDTNHAWDVFVHDRVTGTTTRASVGAGGAEATAWSWMPALSGDGRFVAFASPAANLVADDTNGVPDVFVYDRQEISQPAGDRDGDGLTDLEEFALGLDATKSQLFFAEGALQNLFETRFSVFNPGPDPVEVGVRFQPQGSTELVDSFVLPGFGRHTFDTSTTHPALIPRTGFSTVFEAPANIVADRTMTWNRRAAPTSYASHAETAIRRPSTRWFLAEGSLIGDFRLYYLLQNPMAVPAAVTIRYMFVNAPPCTDTTITVPPFSRHTIEVHTEVPAKCGLSNVDVSAEITSDTPVIVERAMYLQHPPRPFFYAGHAAQGILAPQPSWRFAEGATGPFFDTFILVLNPDPEPTDVRLVFMLRDGTSHIVGRTVPGHSRRTYWLDVLTQHEDGGDFVVPREGGVSTLVYVATPGKTVIAERAMWWPGPSTGAWSINPQPLWEEAHASAGATTTATRWALAEAEAQGPTRTATYALVSNTWLYEAKLRLTLHFTSEDGLVTSHVREICVAGYSRTTWAFPWEADYGLGNCGAADDFHALFADPATRKRFSVTIEALPHGGQPPAPLVVERAQYSADQPATTGWVDPYTGRFFEGPYWPAGSNALATPLPESAPPQ